MTDMDGQVLQAIDGLREYKGRIYDAAKGAFRGTSEDFCTADIFLIAATNRAFCLLRGFCDLLESENFLCAAPLIRLQLDTCLRVAALGWVDDPNEFASKILGGTPIDTLRDNAGKPMKDSRLRDRLKEDFPWITPIYKHTSGFVHLSEKHIFNALSVADPQSGAIRMKMSDRDTFVPTSAYLEAVDGFRDLTALFLDFVNAWGDVRKQR